jgi:hypothetical protein
MSESLTIRVRLTPGATVYRVFHVDFSPPHVHVQIGTVTPCGEWVDVGHARYPAGLDWHLRRCDAEASAAGAIRTHATRCMEYAAELMRRAAS